MWFAEYMDCQRRWIWFVIIQNKDLYATPRGLCAYDIHWETTAACPRNATVSGISGSCSLTDPATGVVYDLKGLALTNSSYAVNNTGRLFKVSDEWGHTRQSEVYFAPY